MKNSELVKLSYLELSELRNEITSIMKLKQQLQGKINLDILKIGMRVEYIGGTNKIKAETFTIEKINRVNVLCKSDITGQLWNIKPANLREYKDIDLTIKD